MAKGPIDDIVRAVLERLGASSPKAAKSATKDVAKSAGRRAASVPAKAMTKAERSAANKAAHAAKQEALNAERAALRPAQKAARTAENKARGVARANRKAEEAYGYGANQLKTNKAKAYYEGEVGKINATIDATDKMLTKGSQGRRSMLEKKIKQMKEYATKEGYKLSVSDIAAITRDELKGAKQANTWSKKRLESLIGQTKGKSGKEIVDIGARRARAQEIKTGKIVTGKKPAYMTAQEKDTQKRLTALAERASHEKVMKKADAKIGPSRGPSTKPKKKIVEQESSKRLRAIQDKNAELLKKQRAPKRLTEAQTDARLKRLELDKKAAKKNKFVQRYGNPPEPKKSVSKKK